MVKSITICMFLLHVTACSFSQIEDRLSPITAKYALSKKARQHSYRLQIASADGKHTLFVTGAVRIPHSLKSIRFDTGEKFSRRTFLERAQGSLDSTYSLLKEIQPTLSYRIPTGGEFLRQRDRFLAGKRSTPYFGNQWINLASIDKNDGGRIAFKTRGFFRSHHEYVVDFLPAATAWEFPAIDSWYCEPAELKFFKLRKLQGYGVHKFRYIQYEAPKRFIIRKAFDVYFNHNETQPDPAGLAVTTDFIEQNQFEILKAELEGGCSIEGTLERNLFLQKARAKVLQNALHRYSARKVKKDTVTMVDVMKQFRSEVEKTEHKWLNKLSNDSIVAIVNANDSLRKELEPIFKIQRKASLHLVMAKKLTIDDQYNKLIADMVRLSNRYYTKSMTPETESRLMGMVENLFEYYEDGYIDEKEYADAIGQTNFPGYVRILTGYHLLKRYEDETWSKNKAQSWEEYWAAYNVEYWLKEAQRSALELLELNIMREDQAKALRMLTDFQAYTYEFIELGLININTLCEFIYPQRPLLMGLILNQYAFLYEMASQKNVAINCVPSSQCVGNAPINKDSTLNVDKFIENISTEYETKKYALVGDHLTLEKHFDTRQKGAYYFLLKEYYLKSNTSALQNIENATGAGDVVFNTFNLWHLISINIDQWKPFENHFYDSEVQIVEMEKLVTMLKKLDANICKPQVNGLYLKYYLKLLYYLQLYPEPGNPKHAKYADNAMRYILNYYKARARNVSPKLSLHVSKQLNDFNWLQGTNAGAWFGYELLNAVANTRLLSEEEMKLYAHYLKLFNPQMKRVPKAGFEKEKIFQLWEEVY